ncbi:MAG: hypothetical protein Q8P13_01700 [bacterium]|nr:hypothetical protein [bacterium]
MENLNQVTDPNQGTNSKPVPDLAPTQSVNNPPTLAPEKTSQTAVGTANQLTRSTDPSAYSTPWENAATTSTTEPETVTPSPIPSPTSSSNTPEPPPPSSTISKGLFGKGPLFLIVAALGLVLIGGAGFLGVKTFVLDKVTTLDLIPDDALFYLSLSVKNNPQALAAKDLIKKFPNGEKVITSLDKSITQSLSNSNNPFDDFLRLSKNELFLTQISKQEKGATSYPAMQNIVSFTDLLTGAKAQERLDKFTQDDAYAVSKKKYGDQNYLDLHLKEAETSAQPSTNFNCGIYSPSRTPCPEKAKPPTIFAQAINKFIIAGPKEDDIKKISDLAKLKASFGLSNKNKLKSIKDDPDHQAVAKFFPSQSFLKYYSNTPTTPYNSFLPAEGLSQSYLGIGATDLTITTDENSKTADHVVSGISVVAEKDGFKIDSLQLDTTKTKNENLKDPFLISESLANQIPATLNGISPAFYAETRNLKQIVNDQIDKIKDLAENSESRNQRKAFEQALKDWEEYKKTIKDSTNLDFDDDILSWLEGQNAMLFNAGSAKTAPEFIILATTKDQSKAENSLSKLAIRDYAAQSRDYARQSDLRSLASALGVYFIKHSKYPSSLSALTSETTTYLRTIPKDPSTKANYSYTTTGSTYTLKANLEDGRIYSILNGASSFSGEISKSAGRITPKVSDYSGVKIYTLQLYFYGELKLNLYFAVTKKKVILDFSVTDKSIKELIDFETKGGKTLLESDSWKDQFSQVKEKIGGFAFIEPIQFWGLVDYIKSFDSSYTSYLNSSTETAYKGYLKTLKSIRTLVTKQDSVYSISTFAKIVELPGPEKKEAEEAIDKLLDKDEINNYNSVLGVSTTTDYTDTDLVKEKTLNWLRGKFIP